MSGTEGSGDPDPPQPPQPPSKPVRPSLPSIHSLFGISREDDLDKIDSSVEGPRGETRSVGGTPPMEREAQPHLLHRPTSAASHTSRPFPAAIGDLHASSLPDPSRRRSSGSSGDLPPGSTHAGPRAFSDAGSSPLSPPETPESASSGRPAQRMVAGRPIYSPLTQSIASSSSTHSSARAEGSRAGAQASAEHSLPPSPHPFRASSTSPFAPFPAPPGSRVNADLPSDSPFAHKPHLLETSRRRHTIADGTWESVPDSRTRPPVRPPSRPQTTASRSRAYQPYPTLPPSWTDAPDRLLPPLPGPSSQSESQQRPSTTSRPKRTSHQGSSSLSNLLPARLSTSPSPFESHPPSSYPRRLPTAATSSSNVVYIPPVSSPSDSSPSHSRPSSSRRRPSAGSSSGHGSHDEAHPSTPPAAAAPRASKGATGSSSAPSGNSKYECPYCQKRFNRPSSLKIHVNTHTGEKPFECPFPGCGRRFSVMSNMRRHSRVHSQPRLNEPVGILEGLQDAEGEPDPEGGDVYEMESMELERPPLIPGKGSGTSSSVPSSGSRSSLRRGGSSSASRRSSTRGTSSSTRPSTAATHATSSGASQLQVPQAPRPIQPAPPPVPTSSRHPSVLIPVMPESLSATAHRIYATSTPTPTRPPPPVRITRSASKRGREDDDGGEESSSPTKRAKDDAGSR